MRAFEFIKESAWDEWTKNKIRVDGPEGDYYVSAQDNHLILHGIGVLSFGWTDRDGEGVEGEFNFNYDLTTDEILDVEYSDRSDDGYYADNDSFHDDIQDSVNDFKDRYSDEDMRRLLNKLTPEEGGIEVDDNWFETSIPFAGKKVGHKEGPAGQWRNKGPSATRPAKRGDLVGGSAA